MDTTENRPTNGNLNSVQHLDDSSSTADTSREDPEHSGSKTTKAKRKIPKPTDKSFLVDFATLQAELGLPRKFLRRLYRSGAFPCIKAGNRPFFRLADVRKRIERLAEAHNQFGEQPKLW